ncbi:hypothetical protein EYF80_021184 [Liparis tanakae]|uniref:Uncharacterized protein n=1 Tax=Liparis tanakae TaxID=230148 RepID=A0A4Z2HS09_9TELE|nr:hypothetical protein EYF80_021184 [Liparis tanakae]
MLKKICLSLPKAVKVTVSHGVPVCRSTICFSLVLSTLIHFLPYLRSTRHDSVRGRAAQEIWHLQRDHVVPAEEDHSHLGTFPGHRHRCPDAHQPEPGPEVRVVLQAVQKV